MTPEEAIKIAIHCLDVQAEQEVCEECDIYGNCHTDCKDAAVVAITALEEIQQYREIGTMEECRESIEKQKPKRPIWKPYEPDDDFGDLTCPLCGEFLADRIPFDRKDFYFHCLNCGQKFDWSENLEGMEDEQP